LRFPLLRDFVLRSCTLKMKVEDQQLADGAVVEEVVQPVVGGFVKDLDTMEDLRNYVVYHNMSPLK
jgi:actin-related protein 7, plant